MHQLISVFTASWVKLSPSLSQILCQSFSPPSVFPNSKVTFKNHKSVFLLSFINELLLNINSFIWDYLSILFFLYPCHIIPFPFNAYWLFVNLSYSQCPPSPLELECIDFSAWNDLPCLPYLIILYSFCSYQLRSFPILLTSVNAPPAPRQVSRALTHIGVIIRFF